jgi:hypothetical protein
MTKKAPSKWNLHVKSVFAKGRASNKDYKFKQALTDAAKTWNGSSASDAKGKKSKKQKGGDGTSDEEMGTSTPIDEDSSASGMDGGKKSKKGTKKARKSRKGKKSGKKSRKNRM